MNAKKKPRREIFECTHCGADVAVGSPVCRECGSDASTGWLSSDDVDYTSVEIPDGVPEAAVGNGSLRRVWIAIVAIVVALALLALAVLR